MNTVTLPWPPRCLTPNAKRRTHWRKYAPATKAYRETCGWIVRAAGLHRRNDPAPHLSITFNPPCNRKRDLDGMLGTFKAGLDGLSDAMGIDDSAFTLTIRKGVKVAGGAVVVTIGGAV